VETQFGYHLIVVDDRSFPEPEPTPEVKGFGFAPTATVEVDNADVEDEASPHQLSWHNTGYRAGSNCGLYDDTWEKLIFTA
jgi:hypothetical protein